MNVEQILYKNLQLLILCASCFLLFYFFILPFNSPSLECSSMFSLWKPFCLLLLLLYVFSHSHETKLFKNLVCQLWLTDHSANNIFIFVQIMKLVQIVEWTTTATKKKQPAAIATKFRKTKTKLARKHTLIIESKQIFIWKMYPNNAKFPNIHRHKWDKLYAKVACVCVCS